jgi:hypothetical protein
VTSSIPWVLERRTDKPPRTTNDFLAFPPAKDPNVLIRKHRADRREIEQWRKWAKGQPEALGWNTSPGAVEVEYYSLRKRGGRIDCKAPLVLGEAMLDGLVEAKFLTDDRSEIVRREILAGPLYLGYYGIRLVIREIEGVTLDMDVQRPTGRTRPTTRTKARTRTVHTPAGGITLSGTPLVDGSVGN